MKTTLAVKTLTSALNLACKPVSRSTSLPILANALLRHRGESLEIQTTDLDSTLRVTIPAAGTPGQITAPVHRLRDTVKLCHGEVELQAMEKNVLAVRNGSLFSLNGLSPAEFPPVGKIENPYCVSLPIDGFRRALKLVSFCQSTDASRYVLNGVLFEIHPDHVMLVATDGRRLSKMPVPRNNAREEFSLRDCIRSQAEITAGISAFRKLGVKRLEFNGGAGIIPAGAVKLLQSALPKKGDGEILCEFSPAYRDAGERVQFTFNNGEQTIQLVSKLIDGTYPNYRQVIPRDEDIKERIHFMREELLHAVQTAGAYTTEKSNSVKLAFTKHLLTVTANAPEMGNAAATVAINWRPRAADGSYCDTGFSIAFNPAYLESALDALDMEAVYGNFVDELSPGVFTSGEWQYVVMPMRLS